MNPQDIVVTGSIAALGAATDWMSLQRGNQLRIVVSGSFSATLRIEYSDVLPFSSLTTVGSVASGTTTIEASATGFYRVRAVSYASGTAVLNLRGFDATIVLDDDGKWDDLRSPASGINPTGPAAPPGIDTNDGTLLFDAAGTEVVSVILQMPHSWKQGSDIKPHVHWTKSTSAAGNVYWRLEYQIASVNGVFPGSWTTLNTTTTSPVASDDNTADRHLISDFGTISMAGYTASCMLKCRVSRIGGDVLDTYGADAKLLEFDIHYLVDSLGSGGEFIK